MLQLLKFMKILVTGTHFTSAQAVIEELLKTKDVKVSYVGRKYTQEGAKIGSVESRVLPKLGVKFIPLNAGRVRLIFDIHTIFSFLKIPVGFIQAFFILLKESPDIILSFGGYVAFPVVFWAWWLNIPIIIHEQTLVSGLSNKISSVFADRIAVSFMKDYAFKKGKVFVCGNPIRNGILNRVRNVTGGVNNFLNRASKEKLPVLYITGGNQGSEAINQAIMEIADKLTRMAFVILQTGESKKNYYEKFSEIRGHLANPGRLFIKKWLDADDVGLVYRMADLVVSRAGVNTLLELAYFGIPTIVIPFPNLYKNEQHVNANFFAKAQLCQILAQKELNSKNLLALIEKVLSDKKKYKNQAQNAKSVVIKDAAQKLSLETLTLAHLKMV